jgi:antimicrobial peptide system SdpB family protein
MNKIIKTIENFNPWTRTFGFIRSLLILSTLLVLIFNNTSVLFSYRQFSLSCDNLHIPAAFCLVEPTTLNFELIRVLMILVLLVAILGFFPRYTGILHWYICYSIQSTAITIDGGEQISTVLAFLLIPITLMDNRKNHFIVHKQNTVPFINKTIVFLFYNLIKFQVCLIYLNAAVERLKNVEWSDGTAIYYFFNDPIFGLPEWQKFLLSPFLETNILIIITWSVTIVELFIAASIIGNKTSKKIALVSGLILHTGIIFTIGIWTFSMVMFVALLFYLLPLDYKLTNLRLKNKFKVNNVNNKELRGAI